MLKRLPPLALRSELDERIGVTDDELHLAAFYKYYLVARGFSDVHLAPVNGTHFLNTFYTGKYAVLITDFHKPGSSGMEYLRRIRERDSDVHILVVSGIDDAPFRNELAYLRCEFLPKPFGLSAFEAAVRTGVKKFYAATLLNAIRKTFS
jgi:DNA-binding response OmpR family regulator